MNASKEIIALRSGEIVKQALALDHINEFVLLAINEALKSLVSTKHPLLIAERIFKFGSITLPSLEKLYVEVPSGPLRVVISTLLVQLGSKTGIETLLDAVRTESEYQLLAVISLGKAGIREACPLMIERLERLDRSFYMKSANAPFIETFLSAINKLGGRLPVRLKRRFNRAKFLKR